MASEYGSAAAPPTAEMNTTPYTLFDTKQTPVPIKFLWSRQAVYPCKIGIRKDIYALGELLRFRAKADVLIPSGKLLYGFSASDTILNGRFNVNIPAKIFAYSKNVTLPNGMNITLSAGSQYQGPGHGSTFKSRFKPLCGVQIGFAGGQEGNVVYTQDGFSVRQAVPLPLHLVGVDYPKVDLEMYTSVKIPSLGSRGHESPFSFGAPVPGFDGGGRRSEEDDAFCVHVHGLSAVVRL
jgi:hypothetical protein